MTDLADKGATEMEDAAIIALYFERTERAISETKVKYGRMLLAISRGILKSIPDAEECENDTYLKTWEAIPPERPKVFSAFLSKIIRNLSLNRYEEMHALKRGGGEIPLLLDELAECIPDRDNTEDIVNGQALKELLNVFLGRLKKDSRIIFMRRYWFGDSIQEISDRYGYGSSKVKMSLMRTRKELKRLLEREGYIL